MMTDEQTPTMAHTPGPWKIAPTDYGWQITVQSKLGEVGIACAHDLWDRDGGKPTAAANARLISAAPNLLSACMVAQKYVEALEKHLDPTIDDSASTIREHASMIRAAIAKALP